MSRARLPANAVADTEVSAIIKNAGGDCASAALKTDDTGRALFEGMSPGDEFRAEVTVDGERLKTETFTMPPEGGLRTMLISGVAGSGGGGAASAGGSTMKGGPPAAGGKDQRTFALGATAGAAEPDAALPTGTLEVRLFDENAAPIANHPIVVGMVKEGDIQTRNGKSDAAGQARFTELPVGQKTGYAVVIDWKGLRLNTVPFGMPESGGARAEIRALARTADPAAITIGAGGRIVVQMREDTLQILEFLPLENTSDKMFDPGPGAFEIPLPGGFVGAQAAGQRTQGRGPAEPRHGRARPDRPQAFAADRVRQRAQGQRSGVRVRAALPWRHARLLTAGAERNRRPLTLITDQKVHRPHRQRPRHRARARSACWAATSTGSCPSRPSPRAARSSSRSADCPRAIPAGAGSRAPSRWRW